MGKLQRNLDAIHERIKKETNPRQLKKPISSESD
jgi:hypothetical protein